ncbi:MAG: serine/threonine protein kinase [Ahniella sp.]|nr:serine/threonine protein kinase [Ahniella sp.]
MRSQVGHYEVVCELGRGGMGVVYKGYESALNRYVAIKTLSESLSHDESVKERFLREARSMAQLNDAHIIQIYFIGEDDGQPFFAMEFVEGESLSSLLKRDLKLSPEQAAKVIHQTAMGLAVAHDKGVVHRDIKPANLMLTMRGQIKIADFGIALAQHDFSKKLTATGEFVGTPGYLSPEVCLGKVVDLRSDVFSLGIVFFEMLTGRMPFTDESPLGLLLEVVRAEIPDVRALNGEVDPELARILTRMVAKEPENRYQDCHELVEDLQKHPLVMKGGPITARARIPTSASTVVAGMKTPAEAMAFMAANKPSPVPAARMTPPTNNPQPAGIPAAAAPMAPPSSARPSVLDRQTKSSSGWIWPVAAVITLGVLGTGAWGAKMVWDRFQSTGTELADTGLTGTMVQPVASSSDTKTTAADATAAASTEGQASIDQLTGVLSSNDGQAAQSSGDSIGEDSGNDEATSADGRPAYAQAAGDEDVEDGDDTAPGLQALAELADKRGDRPIGLGDPGLTIAAESALEQALTERGFLLADEDLIDGVDRIIESGRPDMPRLLGILARENGIRAVTVVRAEELGSTPLTYYGQTDTLYSANLTIKTIDVFSKQPVGPQLNTKVDFTNLTATEKAQEAVAEGIDRYISSMGAYRPSGTGG